MAGAEQFIPQRVRNQLLALGIPAAKHKRDALATLFPPELNIGATGLSAADMARVLIYMVEKKTICVPGEATSTSVQEVRPGWHFCQFYRDFNELLDLVAPYVAEGLKNGEGCLWVMPEVVTSKAAAAVAQHTENVDAYISSGQLEILPHPQWYLDPSGQLKTFEQIAEALIAKQNAALAKGFKFLRAAGDAGWVSGTEQSKSFIDYEMKVNAALGATQVAAICTYRAAVTAREFLAIMNAHQDALYQAKSS